MPETKITDDVAQAAEALRQGLIVAFPTETVYGLGVDATNSAAIERLFEAKGRPSDNPLIVHIGKLEQWTTVATRLTQSAELLLKAFAPGPITVVVEKAGGISELATAGLHTVGLRIPGHERARRLLELCDLPIAAPSANRSGKPSCTTWKAVLEDMDGRIDYVLRGDVCDVGLESTVVDCTGRHPIVLRAGRISLKQLQSIIPTTKMFSVDDGQAIHDLPSPGVRHAHYQPRASVVLFESIDELSGLTASQRSHAALAALSDLLRNAGNKQLLQGFAMVQGFDSIEHYGREFYELLRSVDRCSLATIYLQLVDTSDATAALRDRQLRAAGKS